MLNPEEILAEIKGLTKRLVQACGGQEGAALIPGMPITRHQTFSEYSNPAKPEVIRLDVAMMLEADCGQPLLSRRMARATGHVLVKLPEIAASGTRLGRATSRAFKETADVFARLGESLDNDGAISADEASRIAAEIEEAVAQLLELQMQVQAEVAS